MLIVWVLVAFLEESIFHGFLMTETARIIGAAWPALVVNVMFSSVVFGLAHGYQGPSGIWSTSILGVFLGVIFMSSGFNL
jgi:uncharacterized protein